MIYEEPGCPKYEHATASTFSRPGKGQEESERDGPTLKPCPFCGAGREDLLILDRQDYGMYWKTGIYCHGCRSTILYDSDTDDEDRMLKDAVAKWNRRRGTK